ncbi:MAG: hypothetical protein IPJ56_09240 [Gemmatimonadetes bacterium]|nr:hypothetical protein [Gemmatimonadota bacterium]
MTDGVSPRKAKSRQMEFNKYGLFSLPAPQRLAMEMALHEEAERRALEGELEELERAWADAEEVAAIADNLFVPESVEAEFKRLKGSVRRERGAGTPSPQVRTLQVAPPVQQERREHEQA